MSTPTASSELIAFAARTKALPPEVIHEAKRCVLGYFSAAFAGILSPIWQNARAALDSLETQGHHPIIGSARRYQAQDAAFLNAIAGNVLDFDDTHIPTIIHPSSPLIPVLLSQAHTHPSSGQDFLHSLVMGIEIMCRMGMATHPDSYKRGFHVTATCGAAGASVANGLLLGFNEEDLLNCLALGCNLGSGLIVNLATPAKAISVGYAARHAFVVPNFIKAGITGSSTPLEGSFGFLQAMSDSSDPTHLTKDLGTRWEILKVAQKPYPTGVVLNPVIDACLALRSDTDFNLENIDHVEVYGHQLLKDRADRPQINSTPDARLSVQHTVAVTLLRGLPSTDAFEQPAYTDAAVQHLAKRVRVLVDPSLDVEACRVEITDANGQLKRQDVDFGKGSLANPLTDEDLEMKCRKTTQHFLPEQDLNALIQDIWTLEKHESVANIMRHLF